MKGIKESWGIAHQSSSPARSLAMVLLSSDSEDNRFVFDESEELGSSNSVVLQGSMALSWGKVLRQRLFARFGAARSTRQRIDRMASMTQRRALRISRGSSVAQLEGTTSSEDEMTVFRRSPPGNKRARVQLDSSDKDEGGYASEGDPDDEPLIRQVERGLGYTPSFFDLPVNPGSVTDPLELSSDVRGGLRGGVFLSLRARRTHRGHCTVMNKDSYTQGFVSGVRTFRLSSARKGNL